MRLSEMVARRLREANFHARTIQLKLRYKISPRLRALIPCRRLRSSMAKSLSRRARCFARTGSRAGKCGCWECRRRPFEVQAEQIDLLEGGRQQRWKDALAAADRLRDKFGESSVKLATGHARKLPRTHP
jgi:hypothetical protein